MNRADCLGIILILGFAVLQAFRGAQGMVRTLLEMIGVIVAVYISLSWYEGLATFIGMSKVLTLGILFFIFSFLLIFFAHLLSNLMEWSFGSLDAFLSFLFGIGLGWAVAHILFKFLILLYGKTSHLAFVIGESAVGQEILDFKSAKALIALLYRARLGPEITP